MPGWREYGWEHANQILTALRDVRRTEQEVRLFCQDEGSIMVKAAQRVNQLKSDWRESYLDEGNEGNPSIFRLMTQR